MHPVEIILLLTLSGYAIYRQTRRHRLEGSARFKLALIYGGAGLLVGGFQLPRTGWTVSLLVASLLLSVIVGLVRGRYTQVWVEPDGNAYSQGTLLTIGLFIGLVVAKFALGATAYLNGVTDTGGFGEVLVMIAVMIAFQAEIVWRRARRLLPAPAAATTRDLSEAVHG